MAKCILIIEKIKTPQELSKVFSHMKDFARICKYDKAYEKPESVMISVPGDDIMRAWKERLAKLPFYHTHSFRKNGVMAYHIRLGYTKDAVSFIDEEAWKKENLLWLNETFGSGNTIALFFHKTEYQYKPYLHGHAIVVPVDEERGYLSAKKYTGKRRDFVRLQDTYGEAMEKVGLERGVRNYAEDIIPAEEYYTPLTNAVYGVELPVRFPAETDDAYAERIKAAWRAERCAHQRELDIRKQKLATVKPGRMTEFELKRTLARDEGELKRLEEAKAKTVELFGSEEDAMGLADAWNLLQWGLENYPDRTYAEKTGSDIEYLLRGGTEDA